jgi:hypothetical protein
MESRLSNNGLGSETARTASTLLAVIDVDGIYPTELHQARKRETHRLVVVALPQYAQISVLLTASCLMSEYDAVEAKGASIMSATNTVGRTRGGYFVLIRLCWRPT